MHIKKSKWNASEWKGKPISSKNFKLKTSKYTVLTHIGERVKPKNN